MRGHGSRSETHGRRSFSICTTRTLRHEKVHRLSGNRWGAKVKGGTDYKFVVAMMR